MEQAARFNKWENEEEMTENGQKIFEKNNSQEISKQTRPLSHKFKK